jgi:DNA replication and repair protein RecF
MAPGVSLFFGENAQGKTNLLEACYYLSTLSSPRVEREGDLGLWGSQAFCVGGRLDGIGEGPVYVKIETTLNPYLRRRIRVQNEAAKKPDLVRIFPCVYFSPDDLYTVKKGSSFRRKYLDSLLERIVPGYAKNLSRYQDVVTRRNAVLKKASFDSLWKKTLDGLDELFLDTGTSILVSRMALVGDLARYITETYRFVSSEECQVEYASSLGALENQGDKDRINHLFRSRLAETKRLEMQRGVTLIGPHRDDLVFSLAGKPVRYFGSQGQQRSVALALRMAEAKLLEQAFERKPALLLDDVFSELDENRRNKVISLREFGHQILLTSTDPVSYGGYEFQMYRVANNSVVPLGRA